RRSGPSRATYRPAPAGRPAPAPGRSGPSGRRPPRPGPGAGRARPARLRSTSVPLWSQPALATLVVLDVPVALASALLAEAEVELVDVGVLPQLGGRALQHDPALLHDVAVVGYLQGAPGVLLHDKHGQAPLLVEP